jgi:hypothetical protein
MAKLVVAFALLYVVCILQVKSEAKPFFFDLLRDIFGGSGRRRGGYYNNYNYRPSGRRYYSNNGYSNDGYSNNESIQQQQISKFNFEAMRYFEAREREGESERKRDFERDRLPKIYDFAKENFAKL